MYESVGTETMRDAVAGRGYKNLGREDSRDHQGLDSKIESEDESEGKGRGTAEAGGGGLYTRALVGGAHL